MAAAMDIFPTVLRAAGGDASAYELDGRDIAAVVADGAPTPHDEIFWEMGVQTAVRRGKWKLVLNGQLIQEQPQMDPLFLADVEADLGETRNLADENPRLVAELRTAAERWRQGVEERWEREHAPRFVGENAYAVTDSSAMKVYDNPNNPAIGDT